MAEIVDFGLQQHKIKMDSRYFENVLSVVAGDTGRRIEVQLLDTNGMVQDTTGLNLRLNAEIAGKATYTDATLVDATTGKYQLDLSNGMFLAPGNWQFQWLITDSAGKKLHSFAFTGNVGKNISEGGSQATNFYLNLEDLKKMQDDLINGTIDLSILETNIAEKLTDLETQYAPKLNEVTAQLAETATKKELNSLGRLELTGVYETFVELQTVYPNGEEGLFLVTEDGYTYRWGGIEWEQTVKFQSDGISANSIDIPLLETDVVKGFSHYVEELGLTWRVGYFAGIVGTPKYPRENVNNSSKAISCVAGQIFKYKVITNQWIYPHVFLDSTGEVVSYEERPTVNGDTIEIEVVVPRNATLLVVNGDPVNEPVISRLTPYVAEEKIDGMESRIDETESKMSTLEQNKVDFLKVKQGKNLFNKNEAIHGKFVSRASGSISSNAAMSYVVTKLYPNTTYSFFPLTNEHIALFDKKDSFIVGVDVTTDNKSFTTPSEVSYGTFSVLTSDLDKTILSLGAELPAYEPYYIEIEDFNSAVEPVTPQSNRVYYIGSTREIKTLKEGIELATQQMDSTLYVDSGTYDLVQEFGVGWFDSLVSGKTLVGLQLKNRIHIVFSPNSKVISHYAGSNQYAQSLYSPFNSGEYGFTLENLTLECSRCRYGIHDERNGKSEQYKATYLNCDVFVNNSSNDYWTSRTGIGGGLGSNAEIVIDGCIWGSDLTDLRDGVYYHQTNDSTNTDYKSVVKIKNCYFETGCIHIDDARTDSTSGTTRYIATNNSFLQKYSGTNEEGIFNVNLTNPNSKLYAWNNEIRS